MTFLVQVTKECNADHILHITDNHWRDWVFAVVRMVGGHDKIITGTAEKIHIKSLLDFLCFPYQHYIYTTKPSDITSAKSSSEELSDVRSSSPKRSLSERKVHINSDMHKIYV